MSYDMTVWFEREPITVDIANRKLDALYEADDSSGFDPNAELLALYDELLARYPALEDLDDDDLEGSVWSVTPEPSDRVLSLNVIWPRADEFAGVVRPLAGTRGLVCFDAYGELTHPPAMLNAPRVRLSTERGSLVYDPDLPSIQAVLEGLDRRNWFAVLERPDGWYIQVGRWKDERLWGLEYREGTPERHFRTEVPTLDGVAEIFHRFAAADYTWQADFSWEKLTL